MHSIGDTLGLNLFWDVVVLLPLSYTHRRSFLNHNHTITHLNLLHQYHQLVTHRNMGYKLNVSSASPIITSLITMVPPTTKKTTTKFNGKAIYNSKNSIVLDDNLFRIPQNP